MKLKRKTQKYALLATAMFGVCNPAFSNSENAENASLSIAQQDQAIKGQVIDKKTGEPVIGANVSVKGTTNGAITDMDGFYSLNAPVGSTLVISFIGYQTVEVKADANEQIIQLSEDAETLDEVVVVGYGTQRKSSITGSVTSIKSEKLKSITTPSVADMLQGKVAGVQVSPVSGQPGAGVSIRVRGIGSISGNKDHYGLLTV